MEQKHAVYDAMKRLMAVLNEYIAMNAPAVLEYTLAKKELALIQSDLERRHLNGLYVRAVLNSEIPPPSSYVSCPKNFLVNYKDAEDWCVFFGLPPTLATAAKKQLLFKEVDWKQCQVEEYLKLKKGVDYLKSVVLQQNVNLKKVEVITQVEMEFGETLQFDHYYANSDDISVYRRGASAHKAVISSTKAALEKNPDLIKVVDAVAQYLNLSREFFTGK